MTREELIQVIRDVQLPLLDAETRERLEYFDRVTLQRLVYLCRRYCGNQVCGD